MINFAKLAEIENKSEFSKKLIQDMINKYFEFLNNSMITNDIAVIYMTLKENGILTREHVIKRKFAVKIANAIETEKSYEEIEKDVDNSDNDQSLEKNENKDII